MSKNLVKILSACAIAILAILTIVGVALCVTEPVGCTFAIEESGENGQYATSNLAIRVEGKDVEGTSVKVKKHSEITVVFTGEGYDFKGWFEGKADEIDAEDEAVSTDASYTFTLRGNTTLTAIRDVIKYDITYAGMMDDGATTVEASGQIAELSQTVEYGATLVSLSSVTGSEFGGWYAVSADGASVDATGTRVANFAEKVVELHPVWSNQMLVTYYKGTTAIAYARLAEDAVSGYTLLTGDAEEVKTHITAGKRFVGWTDITGATPITSVVYDINGLALYLKEETIVYTLNVKYNAVTEENSSTITYDIDNGFSAYALENSREFYTFKGFEANGVVYNKNANGYVSATGANLSDAIIAGTATALTAVWECEYAPIMLNITAYAHYTDPVYGESDWAVYGTKDAGQVEVKEEWLSINFEDKAEADYYDITDNVFETFIGKYSNLYVLYGDDDTKQVNYLNEIKVWVENDNTKYEKDFGSDTITFGKLMSYVESKVGADGLQGIPTINVTFMFEVA